MTVIYLIIKEFKQMFRNILLPVVFVLLPIVFMNGIPRLASQEIKGLKMVAVDNDHSSTTSKIIHKIDASKYIDLYAMADNYDQAMDIIDAGEADIIIEFKRDFEKELLVGGHPEITSSANSTNGTKGGMAQAYISQIIADYLSDNSLKQSSSIKPLYLYNSILDYKLYLIPALFGMLLILSVGFLPALNIVNEKEKGTIEQMNVTPIRKWEFIVSKLVPYIIIGILMVLEALFAAEKIYGYAPVGRVLDILFFVFIFCLLVSSFGLIISNYSNTIQQAALTMFFFLVIFLLMSGLLTPIQSMPKWAQYITYVNPLRYFVSAMRAIYIKGATLLQLSTELIVLVLYSTFTWIWAILSYHKNS